MICDDDSSLLRLLRSPPHIPPASPLLPLYVLSFLVAADMELGEVPDMPLFTPLSPADRALPQYDEADLKARKERSREEERRERRRIRRGEGCDLWEIRLTDRRGCFSLTSTAPAAAACCH